MAQNAYLLAKIDADTAEKEQKFAEILLQPRRRRLSAPTPGKQRCLGRPEHRTDGQRYPLRFSFPCPKKLRSRTSDVPVQSVYINLLIKCFTHRE